MQHHIGLSFINTLIWSSVLQFHNLVIKSIPKMISNWYLKEETEGINYHCRANLMSLINGGPIWCHVYLWMTKTSVFSSLFFYFPTYSDFCKALFSTNGTYLNWEKLKRSNAAVKVCHGDIISFAAPPQSGNMNSYQILNISIFLLFQFTFLIRVIDFFLKKNYWWMFQFPSLITYVLF